MKNFTYTFIFLLGIASSFAQVGIGTDNPSPKAALDVRSQIDGTGDYYGFMPPRVPDDAAKLSINPAKEDEGLMVFVESTGNLEIWNGVSWERIRKSGAPGNASDLFISEYVCGTGSEKAIEIANFTGSSKNLANYQLRIGNGKTSSFTTIALSGTLNDGEVWVITDTGATNISGNQSVALPFDGDDAVILQTSAGADIDIIGMKQLDWPFGINKTLRRKPGKGPNLICDLRNFYILSGDTIDGLGSHRF